MAGSNWRLGDCPGLFFCPNNAHELEMIRLDRSEVAARTKEIDDLLRDGPIHVLQDGVDVAVLLSPADYQALLARGRIVRPQVRKLLEQSIRKHGEVYVALARWEAEHPGE